MKQYTNSEQTAKLIELGFEKPNGIVSVSLAQGDMVDMCGRYDTELEYERAYTIGELLSFLPEFVNWTPRVIRGNVVEYSFETDGSELYYCNAHNELIDNLFDMCKRLKEEEVI